MDKMTATKLPPSIEKQRDLAVKKYLEVMFPDVIKESLAPTIVDLNAALDKLNETPEKSDEI